MGEVFLVFVRDGEEGAVLLLFGILLVTVRSAVERFTMETAVKLNGKSSGPWQRNTQLAAVYGNSQRWGSWRPERDPLHGERTKGRSTSQQFTVNMAATLCIGLRLITDILISPQLYSRIPGFGRDWGFVLRRSPAEVQQVDAEFPPGAAAWLRRSCPGCAVCGHIYLEKGLS